MQTCNSEKFAVIWSFAVFPEDMGQFETQLFSLLTSEALAKAASVQHPKIFLLSCNTPQKKSLRGSREHSSFNNSQAGLD